MARLYAIAGSLAILSVTLAVSKYLLWNYQDTDFTLHFYEYFGVPPASVLRGKVVWITGASHGIGEFLAYEFIKHGSKVVLSARRVDKLNQVRENCIALARKRDHSFDVNNVLVVPLDVTQFKSHTNVTSHVVQHFGQIDILINNAGEWSPVYVMNTTVEDDKVNIDTNFLGGVSLTKAVLPYMVKRKQGHIANSLSVWAKYGFPTSAMFSAAYAASKAYIDALRLEMLNHSIRFTSFMIGVIDTPVWEDPKTSKKKHFKECYPDQPNLIKVISMERYAWLVVTSLVNGIEEAWISRHPYLAVTYMSQYTPWLYSWYSKTYMMEWFSYTAAAVGIPPPP